MARRGSAALPSPIAESAPQRLYALIPTRETRAEFRSDDAGATWQRVSTDQRLDVDIKFRQPRCKTLRGRAVSLGRLRHYTLSV